MGPEPTAGKRNTRLNTGQRAEAETLLNKLKTTREYYIKSVNRINEQANNETLFNAWSKGDLEMRAKKLESASEHLEKIHMERACGDFDEIDDFVNEDEQMDDTILALKAKLADRLNALDKPQKAQASHSQAKPLQIEVQQTDATGNVPNNWGTFDGDYSKWKSFRDRWMILHKNTKVKTIVKFQNLKTACIGAAEGALGEWDLTDENYEQAWKRLQGIYEDDYMQVHAFMQKLSKLPHIKHSSSQSIRDVIDTVQKHIHGLKRYIAMNESHPYVVFAVIDRMDTDTYRAWEKYRPTLAKANAQEAEASNNPNASIGVSTGKTLKYIPTWAQLEEFLEGEVTIRVHAEKRNSSYNDHTETFKRQKHLEKRYHSAGEDTPEFLQCKLCDNTHPLYRCNVFEDMSLVGRKNYVQQNELCDRCLRKKHDGSCERKENNRECPKCKPVVRYHNSTLCPNAELNLKQARRHRSESSDEASENENMPSNVNRIGD